MTDEKRKIETRDRCGQSSEKRNDRREKGSCENLSQATLGTLVKLETTPGGESKEISSTLTEKGRNATGDQKGTTH